MDVSTLTPEQRQCVQTLDAPLVVSAGAGSGKTHTLVCRIVWALSEGSVPDGGAFASDVRSIAAITFTEKAAQELKSRVKAALLRQGMRQQSLRVDDAWFSTIHGMCSRILRRHALEAGLDPWFKVLANEDAFVMRRQAVEEALTWFRQAHPEKFDALTAECGVVSGPFQKDSLPAMVMTLLEKTCASPEGLNCLKKLPDARPLDVILDECLRVVQEAANLVRAQRPSKTKDAWVASAEVFLQEAAALKGVNASPEELLCLLDALPWPPMNIGTAEYRRKAASVRTAFAILLREALYGLTTPVIDALCELAGRAHKSYKNAKRQRSALDNDDLLVQTAVLLEGNPAVSAAYQDAFSLVMVDEFQDTDALQVRIVKKIAGSHACKLCVVGDEQQSIYGFRGADVEVFRRHREALRKTHPENILKLSSNFRSHGDILRFADRVFGGKAMFGSGYMPLQESRSALSEDVLADRGRRIDVLLTLHDSDASMTEKAQQMEALRIADALAELRQKGFAASDMALLLGRMTHAHIYAQALRSRGFSCMTSGGSVFSRMPEVRLVACLLKVLENPRSTKDLHELLASPIFNLKPSDMLLLAKRFDTRGCVCGSCSLEEGLRTFALQGCPDRASVCLQRAVSVLGKACYAMRGEKVSRAVRQVVIESGWMSRLELGGADGLAAAANVLKALRLVEKFESDGTCGPAGVARRFCTFLDSAKEAPGVLSADEGDFIKIMSVHASKGLEFPVVAVADMEKPSVRRRAFLCESAPEGVYVSLMPKKTLNGFAHSGAFKKALGKDMDKGMSEGLALDIVDGSSSPAVYQAVLRAQSAEKERAERRRLFYVAVTRAKEALIIAGLVPSSTGDSSLGAAGTLMEDVRSALFGDEPLPEEDSWVDFGGRAPALVRTCHVYEQACQEDSLQISEPRQDAGVMYVRRNGMPHWVNRENVVSYSSLETGILSSSGSLSEEMPAQDDLFWKQLGTGLEQQGSAVGAGTAFHVLARRCLVSDEEGRWRIRPAEERVVEAVFRRNGLDSVQRLRLRKAMELWCSSGLARQVEAMAYVRAEFPFCVSLDSLSVGLRLEGSMDLFASDCEPHANVDQEALIVGYKTGGCAGESDACLRKKHALQAACYAYAALMQGFEAVRVVFVRVEHGLTVGERDELQYVEYKHQESDKSALLEILTNALSEGVAFLGDEQDCKAPLAEMLRLT